MKSAARSMPGVPINRPSNSSDARNSTSCFMSTWKFASACGPVATEGAVAGDVGKLAATSAALQANPTASTLQPSRLTNARFRIAADSMPASPPEQSALRIGVDVGGTFTDLVCFDPDSGALRVEKLPSTPPDYHLA